jgi:hypothetical protein
MIEERRPQLEVASMSVDMQSSDILVKRTPAFACDVLMIRSGLLATAREINICALESCTLINCITFT